MFGVSLVGTDVDDSTERSEFLVQARLEPVRYSMSKSMNDEHVKIREHESTRSLEQDSVEWSLYSKLHSY